jgi:tetratricopeptide (TPR) repeat protein
MSSQPMVARSVISRVGLWLLAAVAVFGATTGLPIAYRRAAEAGKETPSALALTYLRLHVAENPEQLEPRLELSNTAQQLGLFQEARTVLAPFRERDGQPGRVVRARLVEIERAAWAAVPPQFEGTRARALTDYRAALHAVRAQELEPVQRESLAALAREAGDLALRADLLASVARAPGPPVRERVENAVDAYLEHEQPLAAARVLADYAATRGDLHAGLRALEYARSAAEPDRAWELYQRLSRALPTRAAMFELGLGIACERGDTEAAFALAERLLELEPQSRARHARMLELATWNGDSKRALAEQLWLLSHGGGQDVFRGVERSARALSDLETLRRLYERGDAARQGREELVRLLAIYEALGEPERALALLDRALSGVHRGDPGLWNLKFALVRASGQLDEAAETLAAIDRVFPATLERGELRADLLLRLGRTSEAIHVLAAVTPHSDHGRLSRLGALAWTASEVRVARAAYRAASELPAATEDDFNRLYSLELLDGDARAACATTQRGLQRFDTPGMLELALSAALAAEDEPALVSLMERTERAEHPFRADPRYVRLRVGLRQQRASAAIASRQYVAADVLLAAAADDLSRGLSVSASDSALRSLRVSQDAQELALALARDDKVELRRLYPRIAGRLSAREQVYLLQRMGRDDDALATALAALRDEPQLAHDEREALRRDADRLAWRKPRTASAQAEFTDMGPLQLWQLRAATTYASEAGPIWSGGVQYIRLDADRPLALARPHEFVVWAGLRELWQQNEAAAVLGVDLRNGASPRPYAAVDVRLRFGAPLLSLSAHLDEVGNDTAALRALGLRDMLGASLEWPFSEHLFGSAGATGTLFSTRTRDLIGAGVTAEAALGWRFFPVERALQGNLRLAARVAPRWSIGELPSAYSREPGAWAHAAGGLVPDSSHWVGVGGTLARGQLSLPPTYGRDVQFLVDGSLGGVFPQQSLGFSVRGGFGTSLFGADLLSVSGRAGNVVGTSPTKTVYSVQLDYTIGLWR